MADLRPMLLVSINSLSEFVQKATESEPYWCILHPLPYTIVAFWPFDQRGGPSETNSTCISLLQVGFPHSKANSIGWKRFISTTKFVDTVESEPKHQPQDLPD